MAALKPRRRVWLVKETAYDKVWGLFERSTREEAEKLAATWRSQSFGVVTIEQTEVEA